MPELKGASFVDNINRSKLKRHFQKKNSVGQGSNWLRMQ